MIALLKHGHINRLFIDFNQTLFLRIPLEFPFCCCHYYHRRYIRDLFHMCLNQIIKECLTCKYIT